MDFAVQSQNEAYKNSAKIIQIHGQTEGGAVARSLSPRIRHWLAV